MNWVAALRGSITLLAMLTLPGWFLLTWGNAWQRWKGLQRWIVAVGLSISFYPVLFYWLRVALPFVTLGPYKMLALLTVLGAVAAWRTRGRWSELLALDSLEWVALAVFGMTLFSRFWTIRDLPYPAWSDSLHHTLLTQLTAVQGKLPTTLEPYFPIPLGQVHLGLYSLSAVVEWLAQVPAHTALLWTGQTLSGLCALGVYLVLDRKVGRAGAVVGAVVAGLLSHQPAFYVNWGRFTQLSSQSILLIAWLVAWEALALWRQRALVPSQVLLWHALLAALLTGAVFLFHFRVAIFYLPLLLLSVSWEVFKAWSKHEPGAERPAGRLGKMVTGVVVVGLLSLLVIAPAAWDAVCIFVERAVAPQSVAAGVVKTVLQQYNEVVAESVPILVAHVWLLVLAGVSLAFCVLRRNKLALAMTAWMISLYLIGNAYRLGITLLNLSNLSGVLIMFYLPIGLVCGCAVEEALHGTANRRQTRVGKVMVACALLAAFVASHVRVTEIEPFRYFVTPADVAAMNWIRDNTEPDATFAVNTYVWLPTSPHGTDAGYWIPYFAQRHTTAGAMLMSLADPEYRERIVRMSSAEERLVTDNSALQDLYSMGVHYVYIGVRGDFSGPGLNAAQIAQSGQTALVYQSAGVTIFRILPQ